jgi:MSHA biogenesis protein MshJ
MMARLKRLAERFDEKALQERALIFGVSAALLISLFNAFLLDPLIARQKELSLQLLEQQTKIRTLMESVQAAAQRRTADPDTTTRARFDELKRRQAALDEILRVKGRELVAPEKMSGLLEDILGRNRRLQLVSLRSLPVVAVTPAGQGSPGAGAASRGVFKHGVELTLKGGYLDLLQYAADLEKLPWQMYWSDAVLNAEAYPADQLTLTLYTLSLDRAWLRI